MSQCSQEPAVLSIATDFAADVGCPRPHLEAIAAAGFSHVHWCHQWNTDFIYGSAEIEQIGRWLKEYGLRLSDLHGSVGPEKNWSAPEEYRRLAGVELVANRIEMTASLGGDVVVMHVAPEPLDVSANAAYWLRMHKTFDELEGACRRSRVRLAVENTRKPQPGTAHCFETFEKIFARHGGDYVGLCYDSGHGNLAGDGLDQLERFKSRLIAIHLHDNDGTGDQHKLPFTGTIDWPRLMRLIARSSYRKGVTLEVGMRNSGFSEPSAFLSKAIETARALDEMIHV